MDIKERIARQMQKAGIVPKGPEGMPPQPAVPTGIPDRIARQINRARVDAAIAAMKTPPPDYVYREPRMPRRPTEEETVKSFLEDRIYDDIPMEKSKLDPSRIKGMGDVHRVIVSEQPREFVVSSEEQPRHGSATFRDIGMSAIEGAGYSELKKDRSPDFEERIVESADEPQQMPFSAIKIDLSGSFGNAKEIRQEPARPAAPPPPVEPAAGDGENHVEMNGAQKQMLAAMRAQRRAMNF